MLSEKSHGLNTSREFHNLLKKFPHSNLAGSVLKGILDETKFEILGKSITRFEYLCEKKFIPINSIDGLPKYIEESFEKYYAFENAGVYLQNKIPEDAKNAFEEVKRLLIYSGVAKLITAGDWSVNRLREAEQKHGLQEDGFSKIEQLLAKKYFDYSGNDKPSHLQKGPGNGTLPFHLLKGRFDDPELLKWNEVGIGDQLYFPLEPLIESFLKDEYKNNPQIKGFVDVLSSIGKKRLKKRWFKKQESATISKWQQIVPFTDLNDVYTELRNILNNPEKYLSRVFDGKKGKVKVSTHFEDDTKVPAELELQGLLLRILGKNPDEIKKILWKKSHYFYKNKIENLNREIEKLRLIRRSLNREVEKLRLIKIPLNEKVGTNNTIDPTYKSKIIRDLTLLYGDINIDPNILPQDLSKLIKNLIQEKISELENTTQIYKKISNPDQIGDLQEKIPNFGEGLDIYREGQPIDFFRTFFQEIFINNTLNNNEEKPDLNKLTDLYIENFNQGYFTQSNKLFKKGSFLFISATRSDSHENDEQFREDIEKNLNLLQPGGCILTDGFKESFSCVYRLDIIEQLLREKGDEFKAEVVIDSNNNKPLSVLIQRKHPKGYLTQEEKEEAFGINIVFSSLHEVQTRPYIYLVNKLRRKLLALTMDSHNIDIFQKLQDYIKRKVEEQIIDSGVEKSKNDHFQYIKELYENLKELVECFPNLKEFIKKLSNNFSPDTLKSQLGNDYSEGLLNKLLEALVFPEIIYLLNSGKTNISDLDILMVINFHGEGDIEGLIRQKVRNNSETRLLSQPDIKNMLGSLEKKLEGEVHKFIQESKVRIAGTLDTLQLGKIYTFPKLDLDISEHNRRGNLLLSDKLPNNSIFLSPEIIRILEEKKVSFVNKIRSLAKGKRFKPICIISYIDCVTNDILIEKLRQLFGKEFCDSYIKVVGIGYRSTGKKQELIRHMLEIKEELNEYKEKGGIIIGGGSWTDAPDMYSGAFKENIGFELLDAVESLESNLRILNICLSYQIWADMIGKKHYNGQIITRSGMLEIGPASVEITQDHKIFRGCPNHLHFTVAMTHSGHICDDRPPKEKPKQRQQINFIAKSDGTGLPIAYTALNDRVIGYQWHPEIGLLVPDNVARITDQLQPFEAGLKQTFGVGVDAVRKNFGEIINPKTGESYIKEDSGDFILVSSLHHLAESIRL